MVPMSFSPILEHFDLNKVICVKPGVSATEPRSCEIFVFVISMEALTPSKPGYLCRSKVRR